VAVQGGRYPPPKLTHRQLGLHLTERHPPSKSSNTSATNNIDRLNLDRIAWRMGDPAYFTQVTSLLTERHVYSPTLWSYGIKNNNVPAIREYLQKTDAYSSNCGLFIDSKLLTLDPVERRTYQFPGIHAVDQRPAPTKWVCSVRSSTIVSSLNMSGC